MLKHYASRLTSQMQKTSAFTLVELLVAISIVGILASFLFVGSRLVTESAKQIKCLNQVRQIVLGLNLYSMDYDGHGPETPRDGIVTKNELSDGSPDVPFFLAEIGIPVETFHCPKDQLAYFLENYGSSYIYHGQIGGRIFEFDSGGRPVDISQIPLISEGMGLHRGANNIGYMDGHVGVRK